MKRYNLYKLIFFSLAIMPLLILNLSGCVAKSKYLAQVAETESTKATFQNEMKKNAALNERISTLNSILSESSTEKGRLRDEIARLEAERDALKRQVNQISSEIERLNLQLASATSENGQLKERIEKLLSEVASITSEINKAMEAAPVAPATEETGLRDEKDRFSSEIDRLNSELDSSRNENGELKRKIDSLSKEVINLTAELERAKTAVVPAPAPVVQIPPVEGLKSEISGLEKEKAEFEKRIEDLSSEKERFARELDRAKDSISTSEIERAKDAQKIGGLQAEIARLEEEKKSAEKRGDELEAESKRFSIEIGKAKGEAESKDREIKEMKETYESLLGKLKKEVEHKDVKIEMVKEGLSLKIMGRVLFASGNDTISRSGRDLLDRVSKVLINIKDRIIKVEGHTDNKPIGGRIIDKFPTNWELSASRATRVVRYLANKGIDPGMMSATGLSMYSPVATNDTKEGREQNRRIEIILYPKGSAKVE